MMRPELSKRLARALNLAKPHPQEWLDIVEASETVATFAELPKWVQDFILKAESADKTVVADVVKAGRQVVDDALAALDALPMVDDKHLNVPWPIEKRPKLDPEVWVDSDVKAVEIKSLYASQRLLTKARVAYYIEHQGAVEEGRRALANVYDTNGKQIIVDGHHRLAAFWLLGAEVANSWFLEE